MWMGIILLAYCVGIGLLIRFFQAIHQWDKQIEMMEFGECHFCYGCKKINNCIFRKTATLFKCKKHPKRSLA